MEPVEIASFDVSQSRSFSRDLSLGDVDADGVPERSRYTPVAITGRFNPSRSTSLDLRSNYNVLFHKVSDVSLSGNLRGSIARTSFSLVRTTGLGFFKDSQNVVHPLPSSTQLRFGSGLTLFGGKLRLDVDGSYDASERRVPDQRWRMEFYTQCCGFLAEYLARDFIAVTRQEFRFTVDLRGIGKLLDLHEAAQR
jgi:hypothetical protein